MAEKRVTYSWGTGRRKTSVARVRVKAGSGKFLVNDRDMAEYFPNIKDRNAVLAPLSVTEQGDKVDVLVAVEGGGCTGQSGAIKLGLARALKQFNGELEPSLRDADLMTRDARKKERKKYGLHGARRGTQFSKR